MARKILTNLLVTLVSLALAVLAAEFALRLFTHDDEPLEDPHLGIVMRPGGDWDANGFRNPKALARADIVAIGDSQTMGWNAKSEETWPAVLGSLASASVYQMALAGHGPVQYAYLAERALLLQPKVVIFGFYYGNDLYDAENLAYTSDVWKALRNPDFDHAKYDAGDPNVTVDRIRKAAAKTGASAFTVLAIRDWLRKHSRLFSLSGSATRSLRLKLGIAQTDAARQRNIEEFARQNPEIAYVYGTGSPLSTTLSPRYRLSALDLQNPRTKEGWRITQGRFQAIKQAYEKARVPFLVLLIPTKEKVYLDFMKSRQEKIPDEFSAYREKEDAAMAAVEEFLRDRGIRHASALPAMIDALARGIRIYDETIDGHPQAPGYRVIAQCVHQYLLEQKLVPSQGPAARR